MNILYLCHRIPFPPNKGDKIRSFNQIRLLARNHNVHLACMIDDPEDRQYVAELEKYCASVDVAFRGSAAQKLHALGSLPGKRPLSVAIFHCSELQKKVDQRLESANIDAVFVFSSAMAEYVMHRNDLPRLMDFVDVDSEKFFALSHDALLLYLVAIRSLTVLLLCAVLVSEPPVWPLIAKFVPNGRGWLIKQLFA